MNNAPISFQGDSPADEYGSVKFDSTVPPVEDRQAHLSYLAIAGATSSFLTGCGEEDAEQFAPGNGISKQSPRHPFLPSKQEAARFLLQASLSASEQDIGDLMSQGFEAWLDQQIAIPIEETAEEFFRSQEFDVVDENRYWDNPHLTDHMAWSQLMSGGNGVRKRFALALSEFFVVSANNLKMRWAGIAMGHYWDILCRNAFGNFRDLLEEVTLSPAMGVFLDMRGSQKSDPITGREPDENFARELLQLFSIGLYVLNNDGSQKLSNGAPIETYTNDDVVGLAKCFTGYNFDFSDIELHPDPDNAAWTVEDACYARKSLTADPTKWRYGSSESLHSLDEKRFLGTIIPAGTGPQSSMEIALDTIFNHPNVGPFFARQMIQRLVSSHPTAAYVQRVASIFDDNGLGRRGDLSAVYKAILLDPEARSGRQTNSYSFGKLREPMLRLAQWARTFGAASESGAWLINNLSRDSADLGQSPLRPPSVFGFFRPGYVPTTLGMGDNDQTIPELQIVNEVSVVGYVNFMQAMIAGNGYAARDVKASYARELELAGDPKALLERISLLLSAGQFSPQTLAEIREAVAEIPISSLNEDESRKQRVHTAVLLAMASPEYLHQR